MITLLAADNFQSKARVAEPLENMQSDETCRDGLVQVAVSQRVRVRVSHEHPFVSVRIIDEVPPEGVLTV